MGGGKGSSGPSKKEIARQEAAYEQQLADQRELLAEQQADFNTRLEETEASNAAELAARETAAAERAEELRIETGTAQRDQAFGDFTDAASAASAFVGSKIKQDQANARLMGTDYTMTDEMKQAQINDYFASIWGEGQQTELDNLMGEFGTVEGYEDVGIARGNAENAIPSTASSETQVGVSARAQGGLPGASDTLLTQDDEESTLATSTILA